LLTSFPYNNYKLIENINKDTLLKINGDYALAYGYRLNQPISCWNKYFLDELFKKYNNDIASIYTNLLFDSSLCCDIAMFDFNIKTKFIFNMQCDFIDITKVN